MKCRSTPNCWTRAPPVPRADLFDGEYFIQKIEWKNLRAKNPVEVQSFGGAYSPEALALMSKEGPKYQYGNGLPFGWRAGVVARVGVRSGAGAR